MSVTNLAVALMYAQDFDRINIACGVAIAAKLIAGADPTARTILAREMLRIAAELLDQPAAPRRLVDLN